MNRIFKGWLSWAILMTTILLFGFMRGWTTFRLVLLVVVAALGLFIVVGSALRSQLIRRVRNMTPEDREKYLTRLDPGTQEAFRKELE